MIEKTITAPAVINLTGIINEVKTDIEARRKKQLAELRREHRGWQARSFSISPQACDAFEEIVFQKWRTGEAAPDSILSAPSPHTLQTRRARCEIECSNFLDYKLERMAAPLVAEILDAVADKIEAGILPQAAELDARTHAFGETPQVVARVLESVRRNRGEAQQFREKSAFALSRLWDFLDEE